MTKTVEELVKKTEDEMAKVRTTGKKSLEKIKEKYDELIKKEHAQACEENCPESKQTKNK